MFDPYRKWLGIPDGQRPPSHYQLLGIAPDENDRDVINAAVVRQSAFVRTFQTGQHSKEATQLLNEIAAAKVCLLDAGRRAKYDAQLATIMAPNLANPTNPPDNWRASLSSPRLAPAKPQSPPPRPARPVSAPPTISRAPPPTAPINYAPLLSVPEEIWEAVESPPPQPIFRGPRRSPAKLPHWLWFVPAGSIGLLVVILLASALMRRPARIVGGSEPKTATTGALATSSAPVSPGPVSTAPAPQPEARPARSAAERLDVDRALLQAGATVAIPISRSVPVAFAQGHGPFVAVGPTVYRLLTGSARGNVKPFVGTWISALHAEGRYYVENNDSEVGVWDIENGACLAQFKAGDLRAADRLQVAFLGGIGCDQLLLSTKLSRGEEQIFQVWEIAGKRVVKELKVSRPKATALSDDGRFLAVAYAANRVEIYDMRGSLLKPEAVLLPPPNTAHYAKEFGAIDEICFSPDGDELAAVYGRGHRIVCWKGNQTVFDFSGPDLRSFWSGSGSYRGPAIEWHPGGRGWLLYGHYFVDRRHSRVTWVVKSNLAFRSSHRFLDGERLIVSRGVGPEQKLVDVRIPWEKIDLSLAAMHNKDVPAWLRPRQIASLRAKALPRADGTLPPFPESEIKSFFCQRLRLDQIEVGEASAETPAYLSLEYSEQLRALPSYSTTAPPKTAPFCAIDIRLGDDTLFGDVWTGNVYFVNSESGSFEQHQETLRSMFNGLVRACLLPYFVPKDANLLALPAVILP